MQLGNVHAIDSQSTNGTLRMLREPSGFLSALVENLPGGAVFVVDRDLRYLLAQGEALSVSGFKPEDFVGQTIFEALPHESATLYERFYRQALAGEPFEIEHNLHNDWYVTRGTPLRSPDGEVYAVLAVSFYITERKRHEANLAFLNEVSEDLAQLTNIDETIGVIGEKIGRFFSLKYCMFAEHADKFETSIVAYGWNAEDAPSLKGTYQTRNFLSDELMTALMTGEPLIVSETQSDARVSAESYGALGIRSFIIVPLVRDREWRYQISMIDNKPREWRGDEIELICELTTRIWTRLERARAEKSLRESEAKYRSLFNSIDEGFCLIERVVGEPIDFRYMEVNPAFAVQTGIYHVLGKTMREVFANAPEAVYQTYENVLKTGEPIRFEMAVSSLDRISEIYAFRIEGEPRLAVTFKDVTERKRAEKRQAFLLTLADRLRPIADPIEIMSTVSEALGHHLEVGRCGYGEVDATGTFLTIERDWTDGMMASLRGTLHLDHFNPDFIGAYQAGRTVVLNDMQTDLQTGEIGGLRASLAVPLVKEGRWGSVFYVQQSQPRQWTSDEEALVREVTERTWAAVERARAEAALRESEIQRFREQSAREQERQQVEALAELDRTKTLFFSNISHEFRTPLTLLLAPLQDALTSLEQWESGNDRQFLSTLKSNLQLAHRNALRLLKLVNTLLDFSRIEAGRIEAVYEPTNLAQFTTDLASVFRSAIERAGLRLIVDCPPLPASIYVDREMWEKIILNLLSNALKFTFEGEIIVSLRAGSSNPSQPSTSNAEISTLNPPPSHPRSHTPTLPTHAILEIRDTGTGIAPEHLPRLFERFYQIRGVQARTHEGSGIGLALVHELVRLQGGTIAVSSTLGQGTCFTITLPLGTAHLPLKRIQSIRILTSTAVGAVPYVEEAGRWLFEARRRSEEWESGKVGMTSYPFSHPRRVLIVDDNADMRQYLTRILSEYVQVKAVADGTTALAAIQTQPPDLVLSDVMMPGLNGFGLLQSLRAAPHTREIPIILLSACAGEEAIVEGLEAGADDYLIKPFSAQELVSRVIAHLQMAQLRGKALQEARSTIRSRDEFLSIVSHELNSPLVSILGWTRLLRENPPNLTMLTKALDTIERNATLQAKLVQDLLDVSRITAGKLHSQLQPVELQSVVETAIATVTQTVIQKGIDLTWQETVTKPAIVRADGDRLSQVFINLLTNAIKFTPASGSITLSLSVIEGDTSAHVSYAEVRVVDTGIGISPDLLPHVFDRFRQAEGENAARGLGLGLAIAHQIVELHNGTIEAESSGEGQGASFIIKLPLFQPR